MDPRSCKVDTADDEDGLLSDSNETSSSSDDLPSTSEALDIPKNKIRQTSRYSGDDESAICDSCFRNVAAKFCVDCSYNYCPNCLKLHEKIPCTKNHRLEDADCTKGDESLLCNNHTMQKTLACQDCSTVLCPDCVSLSHADHKVEHIMKFMDSTKKKFERSLKSNKETLENITFNIRNAENLIAAEELKTSNLIDDISKRCEDAKKVIDEYLDEVKKKVDDKFQKYRKLVDDFLSEMRNKESSLKEVINLIEYGLDDLNCLNVGEQNSRFVGEDQTTSLSTVNRKFRVLGIYDSEINRPDLEKVIGTVLLVPEMKLVDETMLETIANSSTICSLALNDYICNVDMEHLFTFIRRKGEAYEKSSYEQFSFDIVCHSLVIRDCLYIVDKSSYNRMKVIRFEMPFDRYKKLEIYSRQRARNTGLLRMSKSCSGNILISFDDELLHLNTDGTVEKSIYLKSLTVYDAIQLDDSRYAVCCKYGIRIIDSEGGTILKYSHSSVHFVNRSTKLLTKDNHGFIYLYDDVPHSIYILDYGLNFISSHKVTELICDIYYCENKDMLLAKTAKTIIWFKL